MTSSLNIHKGVLLYCALLVALLFWLSVSFVTVAYGEKRDTDYQQYHLETDQKIRNATLELAEEQAASHWLTSFDVLYSTKLALSKPRQITDDALNVLPAHFDELLSKTVYANKLKFRREQIYTMVEDLETDLQLLAEYRGLLDRDLSLPLAQRDRHLELKLLNYYSNVVEQFEMLRYAVGYVSANQSRSTQNLLTVSDVTWNLRLFNQRLSALIESYLTTGNIAKGETVFHANGYIKQIKDSINSILLVDSYSDIDPDLNKEATSFSIWYKYSYKKMIEDISNAMAENDPSQLNVYQWKEISAQMSEYTDSILERTTQLINQNVEKANQRANRNLAIDILLVLLCVSFVFIATWIVRRVHHQATHDVLTGLSNRRLFALTCERSVTPESDESTAIIKADLSRFKMINDSIGHFAADELLRHAASRLKNSFPQSSLISRLGGDEFSLLIKGMNRQEVKSLAGDVVQILSGQYQLTGHTVNLKACVGYACSPLDAKNSEDLIKAADLALYEAKHIGPGSAVSFSSGIAEVFHERQQLESELNFALQRGEFELHYQPQVDVGRRKVDGVEALIRWRHPTRGMVSPFYFIPIAEDAGMLPAIGEWVINEASRQSAIWKKEFDLDLRVSVNVSAHQFVEGDIVEIIRHALDRDGISPESFEIEITETVAMYDVETVIEKLNAIHKTGVRIALDDFGTGYSSLSYLQDLPLDTLKIDQSFINKIDGGTRAQKLLLESIASMAQRLELHTVAEGVETDSQLHEICALGIDTIQGYYYSKPVTASDLPRDVAAIDAAYGIDQAA